MGETFDQVCFVCIGRHLALLVVGRVSVSTCCADGCVFFSQFSPGFHHESLSFGS